MRKLVLFAGATALPILIAGSAAGQTSPPRTPAAVAATRAAVRELPADQQIIHALSRLTFGAKPGDVQRVRAIGLDKWIDQQLHPDRIDDSGIDSFVKRYPTINRDQTELLQQYNRDQQQRRQVKRATTAADSAAMRREMQQMFNSRRTIVTELQSARVARAVASERQLQEVMTDFWHNHFNVFAQKGAPEPYFLADYDRTVIRPNALGKFRDLLGGVAKSPAMLFYLDNARSTADSTRPTLANAQRNRARAGAGAMRRMPRRFPNGRTPTPEQMQRLQQQQGRRGGLNENYGRELLELHTLGVDGGYTQQDVINVARAFTGWTIKQPQQGGGFVFRPQVHDAGEKVVLGNRLAAGRGIEDGEQVLDILARSPVTARYIATKLARRFISDVPPQAVVDRAAQTFLATDGDIREVVRSIITSPEFFSQQAFRGKVKSPFEVVVSAMRALNAKPDSTPRTALVVAYLGQPIYGHQAPNGWPETGEAWMNTGAILNRINFGMGVAAGRLPGVDIRGLTALDTMQTATREKQVDAVVASLLNGIASPDTRAVLVSGENPLVGKATAGSGTDVFSEAAPAMQDSELMMNARPNARRNNPNMAQQAGGKRAALEGRGLGNIPQLTGLAQIVGLALGSPEFQRR